MGLKQVILVRQDLKLPKGKVAAQTAHAAVEAVLRSEKSVVKEWRDAGMAKIVLKVPDEKALLQYNQRAKDEGITTAVITDAGRTVVAPGTRTCGAFGPAEEEVLDALFADLQLL